MESFEGILAFNFARVAVVRLYCADLCVQSAHICRSEDDLLARLPVKIWVNKDSRLAHVSLH